MYINADYYYHGSSNCQIHFEEDNCGSIILRTDYGEQIASVYDISQLQCVLHDLQEDKYA